MKMPKCLRRIGRFFKKNGPVILSAASVVGVVGTFALTVAANDKANERRHEAQSEKGENLTTFERIKAEAPAYILPAATCLLTSGMIIANAIVNKRIQAGLVAAAAMSSKAYTYLTDEEKRDISLRKTEKAALDKKRDIPVPKDPEEHLWYDAFSDQFFCATLDDVRCAELNAANAMLYYGGVEYDQFLKWAGCTPLPGTEALGWSVYAGEVLYGYHYIEFSHDDVILPEGYPCTVIDYPYPPHADYLDCD